MRILLAKAIALNCGYDKEIVTDPKEIIEAGNWNAPYLAFSHGGGNRRMPCNMENQYRRFSKSKVVLLVRDPRDVVVSYYFHRTRRKKETYELSEFLRDTSWGIERVINYMNGWFAQRENVSEFLLVRFEDLYGDASFTELRRLLEFVGLRQVSDATIHQSLRFAEFDNLRRMSVKELGDREIFRPTDEMDVESYKFRKGKAGGYTEYLSSDDLEYANEQVRLRLNPEFGYR